jgi:hypothetical protein
LEGLHIYPTRRTVPINDNQEFQLLAQKIDDLLVLGGHQQRRHKGSTSWLGLTTTQWYKDTVFKLCYYGEGDMAFGVRQDFIKANAPKLAAAKWPHRFGVPPRTDVEFWGFLVRNDEASLKRIDRVLQGLGILFDSGVDRPVDYQTREKQFDEALDSLGL